MPFLHIAMLACAFERQPRDLHMLMSGSAAARGYLFGRGFEAVANETENPT